MDPKTKLSGEMDHELQHEPDRYGAARLAGSPGAFVFASAIGQRIPLAPPDAGGGGSGGDGGAGGDSGAGAGGDGGQGGAGGEGGAGGDGKAEALVRPDYIPENWWDAEKGFKADDLNALTAFKAEHDANMAQVPEKSDGYKVELPAEFKLPDGFELGEGESVADLIDPDDPRIAAARDFAHANSMSQAQFSELIAFGVQMDMAEHSRLNEAVQKQVEKLGPKAQERVGAVKTWIGAKLPAAQAEALTSMMFTASQIEAFESLMRLNRGAVPGNPGAGRDSGKQEISDEEYNRMTPTERINYARQQSKR